MQPWGYWISYFAGVARRLGARHASPRAGSSASNGTAAVVAGFSAGQANTVLVGIPMILKAYGEEGAVPLFLLIAVHLPVTMTLATRPGRGPPDLASRHPAPARDPSDRDRHPRRLARCRPIAASFPRPLWQIVDMIAAAAVPCALVGMGIALYRYGLGGRPGSCRSLITGAQARRSSARRARPGDAGLRRCRAAWAGVAVLFASCPSGINAYLFAERYGEGVAIASSASPSTALALGTTLLWLQILGVS